MILMALKLRLLRPHGWREGNGCTDVDRQPGKWRLTPYIDDYEIPRLRTVDGACILHEAKVHEGCNRLETGKPIVWRMTTLKNSLA